MSESIRPRPIASAPVVRLSLSSWLLLLWGAGTLVWLYLGLRAWQVTNRLRLSCEPIYAPWVQTTLRELGSQFGVRYAPEIISGEAVHSLALTGVLRPAILLPVHWNTLHPQELRLMLAHELAHQKRLDLAWNWLLLACQVMFWFHPLVWLGARNWRQSQEAACDALVVHVTGTPVANYGEMLLRAALHISAPRNDVFAVGVSERYESLQGRLKALKYISSEKRWMLFVPLALGTLVLVPWKLTRAQSVQAPSSASSPDLEPLGTSRGLNWEQSLTLNPTLEGKIVDANGQPVPYATVYSMRMYKDRVPPLFQVKADVNGRFRIRQLEALGNTAQEGHREPVTQLVVDGGARGIGQYEWMFLNTLPSQVKIELTPTTTLTSKFQDEAGRPVAGANVRLVSLHEAAFAENAVPRPLSLPSQVKARFQGRTDAQGRVTLKGLPQGWMALLGVNEEATTGPTYAPLTNEEAVPLDASQKQHSFRLVRGTSLSGQLTFETNGSPIEGVRVWARLIGGTGTLRDRAGRDLSQASFSMAAPATDSQGRYRFASLPRGEYEIWPHLSERASENWVAPRVKLRVLPGRAYNVNLLYSKGAVIEGRVLGTNGKPVAGQYVGLNGPNRYSQYDISQNDGSFRFRAVGGKQHLWLHRNNVSPPPGFALPASQAVDFELPLNSTRRFTFRLPRAPLPSPLVFKPIVGQVRDETGQVVAGAQVQIRTLSSGPFGAMTRSEDVVTNAQGRFVSKNPKLKFPAMVWARTDDRISPQPLVAFGGDLLDIRIRKGAFGAITGRVLDKAGNPLANLPIQLLTNQRVMGTASDNTITDGQGRYVFRGLRPETLYSVMPLSPHYSFGLSSIVKTQPGITKQLPILKLERLESFVAGKVVYADGSPAARVSVSSRLSGRPIESDGVGRFRIPQPKGGDVSLKVWDVWNGRSWKPFQVKSGRSDLILRLSDDRLESRSRRTNPLFAEEGKAWRTLIGQVAPDIVAQSWSGSAPQNLASLRGRVVLLHFFSSQALEGNTAPRLVSTSPEFMALARRFDTNGVNIIGIHTATVRPESSRREVLQHLPDEFGHFSELAIDAFSQAPTAASSSFVYDVGKTHKRYRNAKYAVINREGRIAYVGDNVSEVGLTLAKLFPRGGR